MSDFALFDQVYDLLNGSPLYEQGRVTRDNRTIVGLDAGSAVVTIERKAAAVVRHGRIERRVFAFPDTGTAGVKRVDVEDYYPASTGEPEWSDNYLEHCDRLDALLAISALLATNGTRVWVDATPAVPVNIKANVTLFLRRTITITRRER